MLSVSTYLSQSPYKFNYNLHSQIPHKMKRQSIPETIRKHTLKSIDIVFLTV